MAQIFDTNTGGVVARFGIYGEAPNIYCIAFSPDGKCLATGSGNGQIKVGSLSCRILPQSLIYTGKLSSFHRFGILPRSKFGRNFVNPNATMKKFVR
jgi:WD40 repeat protein